MGYQEEDPRGEVPFTTHQPLPSWVVLTLIGGPGAVCLVFPLLSTFSYLCRGGRWGGGDEDIKPHLLDREIFAFCPWDFFYSEGLFLSPCQLPL